MNFNRLKEKALDINYLLYFLIGLVILLLVYYIYKQVNKKQTNNKEMKQELEIVPMNIRSINASTPEFKYKLRDYYIASSYNSCCGGTFKNDYVDYVPLKQVIKKGARLLDFEIYSINEKPVIAASTKDSVHIKETYNSLPFEEVMDLIKRYAFSSGTCPNANDPLFLHFRVMSNHLDIYKDMAKILKKNFSSKLLGSEYQYESHGENIGAKPIKEFIGKVIIICDNQNDNFRKVKDFDKLVNITSNSLFLRKLRNYDVIYNHDTGELMEYNKKNMSIVMPDLTNQGENMSAALDFRYGCQFVCMNYQTLDANLTYYLDLFNSAGYSFILKPKQLRYIPLTIPKPKIQNPENSYAPRTVEKPYFRAQI